MGRPPRIFTARTYIQFGATNPASYIEAFGPKSLTSWIYGVAAHGLEDIEDMSTNAYLILVYRAIYRKFDRQPACIL